MTGTNSHLFWLFFFLSLFAFYLVELVISVKHKIFFRMKHVSTCTVPVLWSLEECSGLCCLLAGALAPGQLNSSSSELVKYNND